MAAVLNLDFMQTMARMVRESFVSQALLCVLVLGFLKVAIASWRYVHTNLPCVSAYITSNAANGSSMCVCM